MEKKDQKHMAGPTVRHIENGKDMVTAGEGSIGQRARKDSLFTILKEILNSYND